MQVLPSIDPKEIPPELDYQWVTLAVMGDEKAGDYERMKAMGWRPVPAERHWNLDSTRGLGEAIEIDHTVGWRVGACLLVERDKVLTERARKEERGKADRQFAAVTGKRSIDSNDLPIDTRGIDLGRILPIASWPALRDESFTWTDKLSWGLWLSGWRYVKPKRFPEYELFSKDPSKKKILFFERGEPRYLIGRKGAREFPRPRIDFFSRALYFLRINR